MVGHFKFDITDKLSHFLNLVLVYMNFVVVEFNAIFELL